MRTSTISTGMARRLLSICNPIIAGYRINQLVVEIVTSELPQVLLVKNAHVKKDKSLQDSFFAVVHQALTGLGYPYHIDKTTIRVTIKDKVIVGVVSKSLFISACEFVTKTNKLYVYPVKIHWEIDEDTD